MRFLIQLLFLLLIGGGMGHLLHAQDADCVRIEVGPPDVHLSSARDFQTLIVQAQYASGITTDVTKSASFTISDAAIAAVTGNRVTPVGDGTCELMVQYGPHTVSVPVKVQNSADDPPISFRLDVMPVFMKAGCNMGSCHGAARGRDGFRLSLFGFDPTGDYFRLTREIPGRRINLATPAECLLMSKATGTVPHSGGQRFDQPSEYAQTLMRWLESGAPDDPQAVPAVEMVEIFPHGAVLNGQGVTQQINVRAKYADGTDRDVTSLAYFLSNNDNSAEIAQSGLVTANQRGEAFLMARFGTHTVGTHFITLPADLDFQWQEIPANNYIDELMYTKLQKLRIQPSELCTDEEFLRRVTIDITGRMPTVDEYHAFLGSDEPDKRDRLVDELLQRKEFVELWVMKWAELLQIRTTQQITYKPMLRYYNWLQEQIANNVPIDQMIQELLGSSGGTFSNAATNYYQNETDPLKIAENVAQVFLGMRIQCAQCHNHPFDRWTMDDYYSFAAFFAQIGRKQAEDPRELIIFNRGGGEVNHLVDSRVMTPKFLGGATPDLAGRDRRVVVAQWLASSQNPYFATNLANLVWAHFFGRGIIHEVDDVRVSNPPVNPELLETLGRKFTEYNYDFRRLVVDICKSRTYQLSTQTNSTNKSDNTNFSHANLRRLRAEVFLDAITQVTDTQNKFGGLPLGARAVQIANGNTSNYFLTTFGRATRETVCSCEVKMEPNLSQALHLLNGDTVQEKIRQGNLIPQRLAEGKTPPEVIEELYIRTLCRQPTATELANLNELLEQNGDPARFLEDVFWALLNSREFLFNH